MKDQEKKKQTTVDKVFLGHTPSEQRKFIVYYLRKYHDRYPKIHVPCVGEYSLVKAAIEAGYTPDQITTSDISLFSGLLGYFFMDKPIDELGFSISDRVHEDYEKEKDDLGRLAVLFYWMKVNQFGSYYFEEMKRLEVIENKEKYVNDMRKTLESMKQTYGGLTYFVEDLRDAVVEKPDTISIINPPAFSKGYERMFNFEEDMKYEVNLPEFNLGKEFMDLFKKSTEINSPIIWYKYQNIHGIDSKHAIFAKQYPKNRFDYWLINDPKFYDGKKVLVSMKQKPLKPIKGLKMFTEGEIKPDSKISIFQMKEENCLYYRDLWAHKLGATKAEIYVGMAIDNKLFGIAGFMLNHARSLQSDDLFENFGFTAPHEEYDNLNRLLMMLLVSKDTRNYIYGLSNKNKIFKLERFKTTCLSKYRKVKLNNGILDVEKREKEGQFYKLLYVAPFSEKGYNEMVGLYLKELKEGKYGQL